MEQELWENKHSGRISCREHGGAYLYFHLQRNPGSKGVTTPLGRITKVSAKAKAEWKDEFGYEMNCETCCR